MDPDCCSMWLDALCKTIWSIQDILVKKVNGGHDVLASAQHLTINNKPMLFLFGAKILIVFQLDLFESLVEDQINYRIFEFEFELKQIIYFVVGFCGTNQQ